MAKKKANGEGSIVKTESGYRGQLSIGTDPITGKVKRKSFSAKTKSEVIKKMDKYKASIANGTYVEPSKYLVNDWLMKWLNTYKLDKVSPRTYDGYESYVVTHIAPTIGNIPLQKLTTDDVQEMYNEKSINGRIDGAGGLSPTTINHIHVALKQALEKAVELNYINRNVAKYCVLPKNTETKKKYFIEEEQDKILQVINRSDRYELATLLGFATGLRQGELIALTWDDLDLENKTININKSFSTHKNRDDDITTKYISNVKSTKNKSSNRKMPIPGSLIGLLKTHKKKMAEENLAAGRNNKEFNIVFQSENGTHLNASNIHRRWKQIIARTDVDYLKFHGIRHTFPSRLLEKGENPKVVQELMGHSSISTTLDTYSHVDFKLKIDAVDKIDSYFNFENPTVIKEEPSLYERSYLATV